MHIPNATLLKLLLLVSLGSVLLGTASGFCSSGRPSSRAPNVAPVDAVALVRRAVENRLDSDKNHRLLRYVLRRKDERRDTTKEIIETREGDVARLIAVNGRALTAEENQADLERLTNLLDHPELQERRHRREQKDLQVTDRLLALLPDAFLYQNVGIEPCGDSQCYRLSFTPNPKFRPPDFEARFLRGIAGDVWIDRSQIRMTRLDAHLISDVEFGFGILCKLDKGGTVQLRQADIGGNDWEIVDLRLNVKGTALLLKSLNFQIIEEASHFSPAPPNIGYKQAIQLLKQPGAVESSQLH